MNELAKSAIITSSIVCYAALMGWLIEANYILFLWGFGALLFALLIAVVHFIRRRQQ